MGNPVIAGLNTLSNTIGNGLASSGAANRALAMQGLQFAKENKALARQAELDRLQRPGMLAKYEADQSNLAAIRRRAEFGKQPFDVSQWGNMFNPKGEEHAAFYPVEVASQFSLGYDDKNKTFIKPDGSVVNNSEIEYLMPGFAGYMAAKLNPVKTAKKVLQSAKDANGKSEYTPEQIAAAQKIVDNPRDAYEKHLYENIPKIRSFLGSKYNQTVLPGLDKTEQQIMAKISGLDAKNAAGFKEYVRKDNQIAKERLERLKARLKGKQTAKPMKFNKDYLPPIIADNPAVLGAMAITYENAFNRQNGTKDFYYDLAPVVEKLLSSVDPDTGKIVIPAGALGDNAPATTVDANDPKVVTIARRIQHVAELRRRAAMLNKPLPADDKKKETKPGGPVSFGSFKGMGR